MKRDRDDLARNTLIWLGVMIWLAWGYVVAPPPENAYDDTFRHAFALILAVVIPLISGVIAWSWLVVLRRGR